MFEVGSTVLYGSDGVCTIQNITHKEVGGVSGEYYVLEPVYQKKSTVFVPLDNERLIGRMRNILSADELLDLIKTIPEEPLVWIEDEGERKQTYKEIISRGDCTELMQLVPTKFPISFPSAPKPPSLFGLDAVCAGVFSLGNQKSHESCDSASRCFAMLDLW